MPLYEIKSTDQLIPFRQLRGGADLYEKEIEDLFWTNPEEFTGEALLRVARQPSIGDAGRPDVIALDREGNLVIVEVKRDIDRGQLAQSLEYAGWARTANLDLMASLYHAGSDAFFRDWQEFTGSSTPITIRKSPRLLLVARDFHDRTESALQFLIENNLPVKLIRVSVYQDEQGRKFVDVEGEHEPEMGAAATAASATAATPETKERLEVMVKGRRVRLTDLLDAGVMSPDTPIVWDRPRLGKQYQAVVRSTGEIELPDGHRFASPSRAAQEAHGGGAFDGWAVWQVGNTDGPYLHELRQRVVEAST